MPNRWCAGAAAEVSLAVALLQVDDSRNRDWNASTVCNSSYISATFFTPKPVYFASRCGFSGETAQVCAQREVRKRSSARRWSCAGGSWQCGNGYRSAPRL